MFPFKSQIAFTVHEAPRPAADRDERAERLEFVREGFSYFAFLLPPVWMVVNRLWLVLFGYVLVLGAALGVLELLEIADHWRTYVTLALSLLVGFEADTLRRWSLDRRNWRMVGAVSGANRNECERRFFEGWVPTVQMVTPSNFDSPGHFEAVGRARAPASGEVMPPKRTGWQSVGGWTGWQRS